MDSELTQEICAALNKYGAESGSDTPDFILAAYLSDCLAAWNTAVVRREEWYGNPRLPRDGADREIVHPRHDCDKCGGVPSDDGEACDECGQR